MEKPKKINIFYSSSVRALILYCLLFPERVSGTVYFFEESLPEEIRKTFKYNHLKTPTYQNKITHLFDMLTIRKKIHTTIKKIKEKHLFVEIFGTDNQIFSPLFYKYGSFNTIEEGEGNYTNIQYMNSVEQSGIRGLIRDYLFYGVKRKINGRSEFVKRVYLSSKRIPEFPHPKEKNLHFNIFEKLENNVVIKIFREHFFLDELQKILSPINERVAIIVGQPFVEEGTMTKEEEKILYIKARTFLKEKIIYFKPHPRQQKIPESLGDLRIIPSYIPFESLYFFIENISTVIGSQSTVLNDLKQVKHISVVDIPHQNQNIKNGVLFEKT